ncbi:MAG TPA: 50S ribosomal protein L21 [Candidatus Paceibacterota bacterium]
MAKIAIIETGGKQYVVENGNVLQVEKITGTSKGSKVTFDKVLLTDDGSKVALGAPYITGAKVTAELIEEGKDDKVRVIRYRQKSRYFKKKGHRQPYAKIKITGLP